MAAFGKELPSSQSKPPTRKSPRVQKSSGIKNSPPTADSEEEIAVSRSPRPTTSAAKSTDERFSTACNNIYFDVVCYVGELYSEFGSRGPGHTAEAAARLRKKLREKAANRHGASQYHYKESKIFAKSIFSFGDNQLTTLLLPSRRATSQLRLCVSTSDVTQMLRGLQISKDWKCIKTIKNIIARVQPLLDAAAVVPSEVVVSEDVVRLLEATQGSLTIKAQTVQSCRGPAETIWAICFAACIGSVNANTDQGLIDALTRLRTSCPETVINLLESWDFNCPVVGGTVQAPHLYRGGAHPLSRTTIAGFSSNPRISIPSIVADGKEYLDCGALLAYALNLKLKKRNPAAYIRNSFRLNAASEGQTITFNGVQLKAFVVSEYDPDLQFFAPVSSADEWVQTVLQHYSESLTSPIEAPALKLRKEKVEDYMAAAPQGAAFRLTTCIAGKLLKATQQMWENLNKHVTEVKDVHVQLLQACLGLVENAFVEESKPGSCHELLSSCQRQFARIEEHRRPAGQRRQQDDQDDLQDAMSNQRKEEEDLEDQPEGEEDLEDQPEGEEDLEDQPEGEEDLEDQPDEEEEAQSERDEDAEAEPALTDQPEREESVPARVEEEQTNYAPSDPPHVEEQPQEVHLDTTEAMDVTSTAGTSSTLPLIGNPPTPMNTHSVQVPRETPTAGRASQSPPPPSLNYTVLLRRMGGPKSEPFECQVGVTPQFLRGPLGTEELEFRNEGNGTVSFSVLGANSAQVKPVGSTSYDVLSGETAVLRHGDVFHIALDGVKRHTYAVTIANTAVASAVASAGDKRKRDDSDITSYEPGSDPKRQKRSPASAPLQTNSQTHAAIRSNLGGN